MNSLNLELYKELYLIREAENAIIKYYHEDEMKTPMHMSMGGEAIAVGVCHSLKKDDQVFGTYRSHAIFLAKTLDVETFFAEMYGKVTSLLKGKGGSMHLCAPEFGFMGTSAIVASAIPVAVGASFANKVKRNDKIVAVFFGDGAIDEGVFWESVNVASLMKLPVLFVCEDNQFAVHTPIHERHGYNSITDIVSKFNCSVFQENSTDVETIHELATKAIESIRTTSMPSFLHLKYYRYLEHVGINKDFDAGYRSEEEFQEWYKMDPVKLQRDRLLTLGFKNEDINKAEENINSKVHSSIMKAKAAPFADESELCKGVFE